MMDGGAAEAEEVSQHPLRSADRGQMKRNAFCEERTTSDGCISRIITQRELKTEPTSETHFFFCAASFLFLFVAAHLSRSGRKTKEET